MRVKGIFKPDDYPGSSDDATGRATAALFETLFPGVENPHFDGNHVGMAVVAQNPQLALALSGLSRLIALETAWCKRTDLRELAIQTVNLRYASDYAFRSRLAIAASVGLRAELLAAIPEWRTSAVFDEEQRLVIEYSEAVMAGAVSADLFARVKERYGETGTIEFTTLVGIWSFWAMLLKAVDADLPDISKK